MGKVGDLIVRLKLKYEDYQKGLRQAERSTNKFSDSFKKVKGVALGVWAAIGTAVIEFGKAVIKSTNEMEDAWSMFTTKAKAGWETFVKSLVAGDSFGQFAEKYKREVAAATTLTQALDADTETLNSIRIKKAQIANQLAQLEIEMRDPSKTYEQRAKAANKYLQLVKPIYDAEIARLQALKDAHYEAFLGAVWGKGSGKNKDNQRIWDNFLIAYGDTKPKKELGGKTFAEAVAMAISNTSVANAEVWATNRAKLASYISKNDFGFNEDATLKQILHWVDAFFKNYEQNRNGEDVQAIVSAIVALEDARAAQNDETKKIQNLLNSLNKSISDQRAAEQQLLASQQKARDEFNRNKLPEIQNITSQAQFQVPDIIPDDWLTRNRENIDAALAEAERLKQITDQITANINDAVIMSLSGATQAFTDCVAGIEGADASQVLAALLEPFASTAISLGEMLLAEGLGIEVFKESLKSLNGTAAIAAGASLIALGSALSSGIRALGSGASESATSAGYDSSSSSDNIERFEQEITVHVVGEISGDKILLAGQKTLNKWNR